MWLSAFLIEDGAFFTEHSEYGNTHYCTLSSWSVLDVQWRGQVLHCWKVYVILVGTVAGYKTWGPDHFRPPAVVVRERSVWNGFSPGISNSVLYINSAVVKQKQWVGSFDEKFMGFRTVGKGEICHLVSSVNKNQQDLSSPLCLMLLKGQLTIIVCKIVM
jgi:hypothetical protein